jgi:hypothetical protein
MKYIYNEKAPVHRLDCIHWHDRCDLKSYTISCDCMNGKCRNNCFIGLLTWEKNLIINKDKQWAIQNLQSDNGHKKILAKYIIENN